MDIYPGKSAVIARQGVPGPPGMKGDPGDPGTGFSPPLVYDSSDGNITATIQEANDAPDTAVVLVHWRESVGDNTVSFTNEINGEPGPWFLDKGVAVTLFSTPVPETSDYRWEIIYVSDARFLDEYRFADSKLIVNSLDDLPAPSDLGDGLGMVRRFTAAMGIATVEFGNYEDLIHDYPLWSESAIMFKGGFDSTQVWNGSGGFFIGNSTSPLGKCSFRYLNVVGNGANTIFDVSESGGVRVEHSLFSNAFAGEIRTGTDSIFVRNSTFSGLKDGLSLFAAQVIYMNGTLLSPGAPISGALVEVSPDAPSVSFVNCLFVPIFGAAVNVPAAFTGRLSVLNGQIITIYGGVLFDEAGLDKTAPNVLSSGCIGAPDSTTIGSFYTENNATETVITETGESSNFTACEDAGAGRTRIITPQTPDDGSTVWIINNDYTGKYVTSNTVLNTSFEIIKEFNGTSTGSWETGWVKIAGTTYPNVNENASMSDNNELAFENLEEVPLTVTGSLNPLTAGGAVVYKYEFCVMKNASDRLKGKQPLELSNKTSSVTLLAESTGLQGDTFSFYTRAIDSTVNVIAEGQNMVIR